MFSLIRRLSSAGVSHENLPDGPLRPNRDVFSAEQDGMTVLLDLRREVFLGVDEVGTIVWQHIERGASRRSIEQELERIYDAPAEQLRSDVGRFIEDLVGRGLVVAA